MARVHDNETLVIGGLIDSTQSISKRKIPYLGDIPGLGKLFSYDSVDNQDRELVVFITPHLVQGRNSLTQSGVTSVGRDIPAKHLLDEFSDVEADVHLSAFENERTKRDAIGDAMARREKNAALEAGRKASDPAVEKQMAMALDAFSPQMLDDEISKALSFQSTTQSRSN
jgi:Flp pilus assembly secretin CpaC